MHDFFFFLHRDKIYTVSEANSSFKKKTYFWVLLAFFRSTSVVHWVPISLFLSLSLAVHNFQQSTRKINSTDWRASVVRMTKNINFGRILSIWRVPALVITHTFSGSVPTRTGCILLLLPSTKWKKVTFVKIKGKVSAQPHTIVKQICFPNGNVLFLSLFSLFKNWMHNVGWGCAEILPN